jgi:hypothetical protein
MHTLLVAGCILSLARTVHAQALGTDTWTVEMEKSGLFAAHQNYCSTSEVFLQVGQTTNLGFCMEKTRRTAATWEVARNTCAGVGKRLPEPAELKYACNNPPTGLSNLPDTSWEWASNFLTQYIIQITTTSWNYHISAPIGGNTNCTYGGLGDASGNTNAVTNDSSYAYRCVR